MISKVTVIIELGRVYYQLFYISVGQKSPIGTFVLFPIPSTHLANLTFHTVCLYFYFFFILPFHPLSSHLFISSQHWSSQVHTGSVTVRPAPLSLPLISHLCLFSHMQTVRSISPTERNCGSYSGFSSSTRSDPPYLALLLFFWFFCIPSQIIHPSPTCSWSHTHTAATT